MHHAASGYRLLQHERAEHERRHRAVQRPDGDRAA
jgi:hypothetical protein